MHGGKGRCLAIGCHIRFGAVAVILPANGAFGDIFAVHHTDSFEYFHFFIAHEVCLKSDRSFHGDDHHQLHDMILEHVANHTGTVVISAPMAHGDLFCDRDLYMVDVVAVPDRFENRIGEPEYQEILNGFFAEIVVDPKNLILRKYGSDRAIEFFCRLQVASDRFFQNESSRPAGFVCQTGFSEMGHSRQEKTWCGR